MAVKLYAPTSPARRGMSSQDFDMLTTKRPLKSLTKSRTTKVGKNNQGRITTRHRGAGVKRHQRLVNFRLAAGSEAVVEQIEYDPNRSARIARIKTADDQYHYILAAKGMKVGSKLKSGEDATLRAGNRLPLKNIALGTTVHAVELQPGRGAQLARSAGTSVQLIAKEEPLAHLRLPSGEVRTVDLSCMASIGTVGNEQHQNVQIGKAGRQRWLGRRPVVRGKAKNVREHPHGSGEGGASVGMKHPKTPWGRPAIGYKTRNRKSTNKLIIRSRHQTKRRK